MSDNLMICPKAKECHIFKFKNTGHNRCIEHYKTNYCNNKWDNCPACVPYEPEPQVITNSLIEEEAENRQVFNNSLIQEEVNRRQGQFVWIPKLDGEWPESLKNPYDRDIVPWWEQLNVAYQRGVYALADVAKPIDIGELAEYLCTRFTLPLLTDTVKQAIDEHLKEQLK